MQTADVSLASVITIQIYVDGLSLSGIWLTPTKCGLTPRCHDFGNNACHSYFILVWAMKAKLKPNFLKKRRNSLKAQVFVSNKCARGVSKARSICLPLFQWVTSFLTTTLTSRAIQAVLSVYERSDLIFITQRKNKPENYKCNKRWWGVRCDERVQKKFKLLFKRHDKLVRYFDYWQKFTVLQ